MAKYKCHSQERNVPPRPVYRAAIPVLPKEHQETENSAQFLLYNSGVANPEGIIIFSMQQAIQVFPNSEHWFADDTFKTCPNFILSSIHCSC